MTERVDHIGLSALGATLNATADRLAAAHETVTAASRGGSQVEHELALLESLAAQLRRVAALVQTWSTDAAEDARRARDLVTAAEQMGLRVAEEGVVPVDRPSAVDPHDRERARARLAVHVTRSRAAQSRHRHIAVSGLEGSLASLQQVAERARLRR